MQTIHLISIVAILAIIASCSNSTSTPEYSGVLRTDDKGVIIDGDSTDWTFGVAGVAPFTFGPAYPNPAFAQAKIMFSLATESQVSITLHRAGGAVDQTVVKSSLVAGIHEYIIAHPGSAGIYRLKFISTSGSSYGDVQFD